MAWPALLDVPAGGCSRSGSGAGKRQVTIPGTVLTETERHLDTQAAAGADALLFTTASGKPLRHSTFRRGTWNPARTATGLTGIHFHDLRHAGNHLVAEAGANLRELMERMGHASSRAALIYLQSTPDRQRILADAIAERILRDLGAAASRGTSVARQEPSKVPDGGSVGARSPPELRI